MGVKDLPLDSGRQIVRVFEAFGWIAHQGKGHIVLQHPNKSPYLKLSIPDHKEVDRFLLRSELRKAGLTTEQFMDVYSKL
jgi:predicted RNA binding protein YcfA (HicA-like mRNA interferase family)